jgi:hypothetical protein
MSKSPIPPDLLESFKEKFAIVKQAQSTGNLALLSAIRKSDNKPVSIVCSIQYEDEGHVKYVIQPLAVVGDQTFLNEFDLGDEFLERDDLGLRERRPQRVPGFTAATNDEERINALLDVLADPSTIVHLDEDEDEDDYLEDEVEDWAFHLLLEEYDSLPDRTIDAMLGILQKELFSFALELEIPACDVLAKMGERAVPALDTLHSLLPLADSERPSYEWFLALKASATIWNISGDNQPALEVANKLLCANDGSFSEDDNPSQLDPSEGSWIIHAARLVGHIGPEAVAAVPRLRELQEHEDEEVRNAVQWALQKLE